MNMTDTIAAVTTPKGVGGVAIVRISGPESFEIAYKLFRSSITLVAAKKSASYRKVYNKDGELLDEVIALVMPAPHSFTMEDTVEIDCHGGIVTCEAILRAAIDFGARLASPGEFTKRAYLNGRLDLSQAEAIDELIHASTDRARRAAVDFLSGKSGMIFKKIRDDVMDLLASIEASVDFPSGDDETIVDMHPSEVARAIEEILSDLDEAIRKASEGAMLSKGVKIVIVGSPNVGKSSLLNFLLGKERAIVSDIPGTTRDTIEEVVSINGIPAIFVDTAGIRSTDNTVEKIGIERSIKEMKSGDIILFIVDSSRKLSKEDMSIFEILPHEKSIVVLNKSDLPLMVSEDDIRRTFPSLSFGKIVEVSALNGEGIDLLEDEIEAILAERITSFEIDAPIDISTRRLDCLRRARASLAEAAKSGSEDMPVDVLCIDIREGLEIMGELTGDTAREDVINEIFAKFCIGK